jgi:AbrB family looped-hinge helix DNA binding protein
MIKKYPKLVQCDKRGQIVIPKEIRAELGIEEGTGFWTYIISDEGILLKKIDSPELSEHKEMLSELKEKSDKLRVKKQNLDLSEKNYKRTKKGKLDLI